MSNLFPQLLNDSDDKIITHLVNLLQGQLNSKNSLKGIDNLQVFSHYLRQNKFKFQQFLDDATLKSVMSQPKQYQKYISNIEQLTESLNKINKGKTYTISDIMQEYYALKSAGISIGQTNCTHLANVLKRLAIQNQVSKIKFWGKILGYKDYFVIQGQSSKKYINQLAQNSQAYGVGVNQYSYWVSTNIIGNWTQLPLILPEMVKASRQIKYIFSGDLEKNINLGKFVGTEKHLLKCVLARITHSCQLAPKGLYKLNEQNPLIIQFEDQFKTPEVSEMSTLDNWVHLNPHILGQGRTSHYIDQKGSEELKEALKAQLDQKDPIVERLKGISDDKPYQTLGFTANWTAQLVGQTVPINLIGKQQGQTSVYAVALLKNLVWPGACTVGYKGGWASFYVGYGHRISQMNNMIKDLGDLAQEGEDKAEKPEPNPSKPPQQKKQVEQPPKDEE